MSRYSHGMFNHRKQHCGTGVLTAFTCGVTLLLVAGCQRTLFRASDNRTQFDTTDQMRQRHVPLVEADEFGNPRPALRARLGRRQ